MAKINLIIFLYQFLITRIEYMSINIILYVNKLFQIFKTKKVYLNCKYFEFIYIGLEVYNLFSKSFLILFSLNLINK